MAGGKTGNPRPPGLPPRTAELCAYGVFEPASPNLKTLDVSCQPTLLFGVIVSAQAPVSAMTLPPTTTPAEIFASNHSLTRLSLLDGPVMPLAVMRSPLPATSRLKRSEKR